MPYFIGAGISFFLMHTSPIFSYIYTQLFMSVGTHLCRLLKIIWCNVNEIKLIINSNRAPNSWEDFRIKGFVYIKNHFQNHIESSMK
jgi:hypothetical protein